MRNRLTIFFEIHYRSAVWALANTFLSTDKAAVLPDIYTFQPEDMGIAYFKGGVTLNTVGMQDVLVADYATSTIVGSASYDVVPGGAPGGGPGGGLVPALLSSLTPAILAVTPAAPPTPAQATTTPLPALEPEDTGRFFAALTDDDWWPAEQSSPTLEAWAEGGKAEFRMPYGGWEAVPVVPFDRYGM